MPPYDNVNHLTQATEIISGTTMLTLDYGYDAFGNMIQETELENNTTTITRYVVDGWNPANQGGPGLSNFNYWAVVNGTNGLETREIMSVGTAAGAEATPLVRIDESGAGDTGVYWTMTNRQGSVTQVLADATDAVVDTIGYDAWGNVLTQVGSGAGNTLGHYAWDRYDYDAAAKLYLDRARVYDPSSQDWLTQDPMGYDAGDSNLYRYVNNRPTEETDPSGLWSISRQNLARATATAQPGDTLGGLADIVGLSRTELRKWLTLPAGNINIVGKNGATIDDLSSKSIVNANEIVEVPNTIVSIFNLPPQADINYLKARGFKLGSVPLGGGGYAKTVTNLLARDTKNKDLQGLIITGGGDHTKVSVGGDTLPYADIEAALGYHLGFLLLNTSDGGHVAGEKGLNWAAGDKGGFNLASDNAGRRVKGIVGPRLIPPTISPKTFFKPGDQGSKK